MLKIYVLDILHSCCSGVVQPFPMYQEDYRGKGLKKSEIPNIYFSFSEQLYPNNKKFKLW